MPNNDDADDLIALTALSGELLAGGFSDEPVEYARLYRGCLSARYPAEQNNAGRWSLRRRHLPAVAAALGLTPVTDDLAAIRRKYEPRIKVGITARQRPSRTQSKVAA